MILREISIIIIAVICFAALAIGFTSQHFLGPDNAVEEATEEVIELETGVKVDLSP